jgi:signal transduction histidine kinase
LVAPCCLNEVLPSFVASYQGLSQASGVDLLLKVETAGISVRIDLSHLERLITNLVVNAIHHTPSSGQVIVRVDCLGNYAILQVIDTGVGMSAEVQKQVFDRFYRVSSDRGQQSGGAGLGLAIVQSIVISYGGTIEVTSQLQQGSIFTIKLPLAEVM